MCSQGCQAQGAWPRSSILLYHQQEPVSPSPGASRLPWLLSGSLPDGPSLPLFLCRSPSVSPFGLRSPQPSPRLFLEDPGAWAEGPADPTSEQTGLVKFPAKRRPGFPCSYSPSLQGVRTLDGDKGHILEERSAGLGAVYSLKTQTHPRHSLSLGEQSWSLRTAQGSSRMLLPSSHPQGWWRSGP